MTTDTPTPNADKPLYGDYGGWSEPELNHAMQNGFGEACKHGQLARSCETCQLERDLSECRAALAERQAAIDELIASSAGCAACPDYDYDAMCHAGGRYADAWEVIRALATKEPQPAAKEGT